MIISDCFLIHSQCVRPLGSERCVRCVRLAQPCRPRRAPGLSKSQSTSKLVPPQRAELSMVSPHSHPAIDKPRPILPVPLPSLDPSTVPPSQMHPSYDFQPRIPPLTTPTYITSSSHETTGQRSYPFLNDAERSLGDEGAVTSAPEKLSLDGPLLPKLLERVDLEKRALFVAKLLRELEPVIVPCTSQIFIQ